MFAYIVACVCSWKSGTVDDVWFLDMRYLGVQKNNMKESIRKIEINLRLWSMLSGIELKNIQYRVKVDVTNLPPSNTASILDSKFTLYQMSRTDYHFPQNLLESEKLRKWKCRIIALVKNNLISFKVYFMKAEYFASYLLVYYLKKKKKKKKKERKNPLWTSIKCVNSLIFAKGVISK